MRYPIARLVAAAIGVVPSIAFAGEISLQNYGGFSSIRTRPADLKLGGYDGLTFRVRDDGRSCKFSLRTRNTTSWIRWWMSSVAFTNPWISGPRPAAPGPCM